MYIAMTIIIFLTSVLIILIVLAQNPKGGGLASNFSGGNQFGGVVQTKTFLDKATWTLAIVLFSATLLASFSVPKMEEKQSVIKEQINAMDFNTAPIIQENVTNQPDGNK